MNEDLLTQRLVNGLTVEDLTDKIEIVGLGFTQEISTKRSEEKVYKR